MSNTIKIVNVGDYMDWRYFLAIALISAVGLSFLFFLFTTSALLIKEFKPSGKYRRAWSSTENFERHLLVTGFFLFFAVPMFTSPTFADAYLFKVLAAMLPAMASGMFLVGCIAFFRELHRQKCTND